MTVTGKTVKQNIAAASLRSRTVSAATKRFYHQGAKATGRSVPEEVRAMLRGEKPRALPAKNTSPIDAMDVIRPISRAFTNKGGLVVLYGNIARNGSIVKLAGVDPKMYRHAGPARIFESQEDACEGILAGQVRPGDVVVIRNEGPKGGPGMQEMLAPTSYIKGMGLDDRCALITDGRFSGGTAGACIGHVSQAEFARRRKRYKPRPPQITHGALGRYAAHATSADTGAVLDWPGKTRP